MIKRLFRAVKLRGGKLGGYSSISNDESLSLLTFTARLDIKKTLDILTSIWGLFLFFDIFGII